MSSRKKNPANSRVTVTHEEANKMIKNVMEDGMLLWVHLHAWGNRSKLSDGVLEEKFGEDAKRIRAVKDLIDSEHYSAILTEMNKAKSFAVENSMPWFHGGVYWISTKKFQVIEDGTTHEMSRVDLVEERFQAAKKKIKEELLPKLKEVYPVLVKKSIDEHSELYQDSSFPDVNDLDSKFGIVWGWQKITMPMGNGKGVTVVDKQIVDRENKKYIEMVKGVMDEHNKTIRKAFAEIMGSLRDKLKDPTKKFKESTIEKPKEFLKQLIESIPIFGENSFIEVAKHTSDILDGVYAEDLRGDVEYRQIIGNAMEEVVKHFEKIPVVEIERDLDF